MTFPEQRCQAELNRNRTLVLYRSARAEQPYFGRGSFWTPNVKKAEWFQRWEAETFPGITPARIYRAEVVVDDSAVLDLMYPLGIISPNAVLAKADSLAEAGTEWVLVSEGPIEGEWWIEAIYLGTTQVAASPVDRDSLRS